MSDNLIILIPTNPSFVPTLETHELARSKLAAKFPQADEVTVEINEEIVFFDCGENFEGVFCPHCGCEWQTKKWAAEMNRLWESKFKDLLVTTPCCKKTISINDLDYRWPQGLARFALKALNPQFGELLTREDLRPFEEILGCELRAIYDHI